MASPGELSRDFPPLRMTKEGFEAITAEADTLQIEKAEVIRMALREYFARRGQKIQFTPPKPGGKVRRMTEQKAVEQVLERIKALELPTPVPDFRLGRKVYDLAWPADQVAVEVSQRKRPDVKNGWTVGHITAGVSLARIDEVLMALPLTH